MIKSTTPILMKLHVGEACFHPRFGPGTVSRRDGTRAYISFADGERPATRAIRDALVVVDQTPAAKPASKPASAPRPGPQEPWEIRRRAYLRGKA